MKDQDNEWLIGVNGILAGEPGSEWAQICDYRYPINQLLREDDEVLMAGTTHGLWRVPADRSAKWVQLHDETLTEVLCLAHSSEGILAGSPYGLAVSRQDGEGHMRWRSLTEHLRVNARFTNAILVDPDDPSRWIVGTEGGVIIGNRNGESWEESGLNDTPVRALVYEGERYLAGTDIKGLMQSFDGRIWEPACDLSTGVFALDVRAGQIVAGSEHGIVVIQSDGSHDRIGPRALVRCVAIDPNDPDIWMAGTDPGGLWSTHDGGGTWQNEGRATHVRDIVVPMGR